MKKRVALVLIVLIMIASAFIGCAKQDSAPADTGAEETKAAASEKPAEDAGTGEVLKIDFMHFFDDTEAFYAPFQFAVEKFNEDNAGKAEIVQDILAHDAYELQTETRGATNDLVITSYSIHYTKLYEFIQYSFQACRSHSFFPKK